MAERFLTVRDVSSILGISEKEVMDLVESKRLEAYRVGGVYIRFKQEQIAEFRKSFKSATKRVVSSEKYTLRDKISDFLYFNDFYILSALIILLILIIIFQEY
ncbi:MAG: helix-turn-helix domain-containing protein [Candidatus Omnitrophica bacterium]|jgi:excisionase family DNA binding protein|nr:helix-turn-helix domain-containing protein [Candidatus Omnitrophota bacterium]